MQEIINKHKAELEEQLKNSIVNRSLMSDQITVLTANVENLDKQIMSIQAILVELNALSHPLDAK